MRRYLLYIAVAFTTLYLGALLDFYARETRDRGVTDCFCTSVQCRVLHVIDHPIYAITRPAETWELLRTTRWRDSW